MTALEFLNEYQKGKIILQSHLEDGHAFYGSAQGAMYITDVMVEFAQYHVQEALKKACANTQVLKRGDFGSYPASSYDGYRVDEDAILNAYPLENIK